MCSDAARLAAATGSEPSVVAPSESSTIAAGAPLAWLACRRSSAAVSASPVAVPPSALMPLMAVRTASRSVVGSITASTPDA